MNHSIKSSWKYPALGMAAVAGVAVSAIDADACGIYGKAPGASKYTLLAEREFVFPKGLTDVQGRKLADQFIVQCRALAQRELARRPTWKISYNMTCPGPYPGVCGKHFYLSSIPQNTIDDVAQVVRAPGLVRYIAS